MDSEPTIGTTKRRRNGRIDPRAKSLRQNDKRHNCKAHQGANQQRQKQKHLLLALLDHRGPAQRRLPPTTCLVLFLRVQDHQLLSSFAAISPLSMLFLLPRMFLVIYAWRLFQ
jgi:hypothetical protein